MKQRAINLKDGPAVPPALVGVMVLLDRSGSMAAIKSQMVAAFGEFVHGQQQLDPEGLWLSLYQFDGQGFDACYERMPIGLVGTLDLVPRGSTPLIDALHAVGGRARVIVDDPADPTERLLLVVISDGEENASQLHQWAETKALLDGLRGEDCEVIYLGTQESVLGAVREAVVQAAGTVTWQGTDVAYAPHGLRYGTTAYRAGSSATASVAAYTSGTAGSSIYQAEAEEALKRAASQRLTSTGMVSSAGN